MSKQTAMMIPPTMGEVLREASNIRLPRFEAEAFFYYYQSNGWKVGKNPMKCWRSAIQGWRIRWLQKRNQPPPTEGKVDYKTQQVLKDIKANKV